MIFVTVGAQMPFDRLIRAVDVWAANQRNVAIFAQIGAGGCRPTHCEWAERLGPREFRARAGDAELLVAHAGMGSILTALEFGRPIVVMPRLGSLGETRNDHQVATAKRMAALSGVSVAMDERELATRLDNRTVLSGGDPIARFASAELLATIRSMILENGAAIDSGRVTQSNTVVLSERPGS